MQGVESSDRKAKARAETGLGSQTHGMTLSCSPELKSSDKSH